MSDIKHIIDEVDAVTSAHDEDQLRRLGSALERFFKCPEADKNLDVWFRLFERFPEDDGYESFWSILHALEHQPNYEQMVVESVRRKPSQFPVLMLNRMLNVGQTHVGNTDLLKLLEVVATLESCSARIREDARKFVKYQKSKA